MTALRQNGQQLLAGKSSRSVPDGTSGAYWLLTPALQAPEQFYCDRERTGGGWVLIGKGREGWQEFYNGQGNAATLLNPPTHAPRVTSRRFNYPPRRSTTCSTAPMSRI